MTNPSKTDQPNIVHRGDQLGLIILNNPVMKNGTTRRANGIIQNGGFLLTRPKI